MRMLRGCEPVRIVILSRFLCARRLQVKYRTPLAVGFLIGASFMMVNLMLITATVSGSAGTVSGVQAVTAFASLLLIFIVSSA